MFTSMFGSSCLNKVWFELKCTTSQFQAFMDTLTDKLQLKSVYVYQDD